MQSLDKLLNIEYPIIMAPMFLVSNPKMVKIALDNGITAAIPAMNFRKIEDLSQCISNIKSISDKAFGINLITNKSNSKLKQQLKTLLDNPPSFIISSLGSPKQLIQEAHKIGIKVFCDVTNYKYAQKVEDLGADAIIAVNSSAGGHSGTIDRDVLLRELTEKCKIPIINAGGVATNNDLKHVISIGASGASIGTIFIASDECEVSDEYKNALIKYGKNDIVLTSKLSGSPSTIINTPYVQTIGTKANILEKLIQNNSKLKKIAKAIIMNNANSTLKKAAFSTTYKTVWCASSSIEEIKEIKPLSKIIRELVDEI